MSRRAPRRTIKSYNRDKYSKENTRVTISTSAQLVNDLYQGGQTIVPASTTQGMRKVKHITISLSKSAIGNQGTFFWALVYVPEGYNANPLGATSLYEPNQYVMACGCIDPDAGPIRIRSPIARNLNSGDSIALLVGAPSGEVQGFFGVVSYAITLQ